MTITLIIPVIIIALLVLFIGGTRINSEKGGEDMIKNVYVYLVLFATLMMIIGGGIGSFMALSDIVAPAPYYQSYEEFKRWGNEKPSDEVNSVQQSEEELKKSYDDMVAAEALRQTTRAKNNLIKSLGWIIIPLPFFLYFQRKINKNETEKKAD